MTTPIPAPSGSSKRIQTPDGKVHEFPAEATDDQINEALQPPKKAPESTFSKFKGNLYDPTIGSMGQGARDLMQSGSRMKGVHEMVSGAEKTALPVAATALALNPEAWPVAALGAAGGMAGDFVAKHAAKGFGAGEDTSNVAGDIGGLVGGGAGGAAGEAVEGMGSNIIPAIKAAGPNLIDAAIKAKTLSPLSALRSVYKGVSEGGKELLKAKVAPPEVQTPIPNAEHAMNMFSALKGPQEAAPSNIPVTNPVKGPSIGQLKTAMKNGTISPEQFDAAVDKIPGIDDDAKALHKADARTAIAPKSKVVTDEPKKTLSVSQMKESVMNGLMKKQEFKTRLAELGYNDEDTAHIVKNLQKAIDAKKTKDD